jgi:hypothetical protein
MGYSEFIEFIARIAVYKFMDTDLHNDPSLPLAKKILCLLDDVFEGIGLLAKDPRDVRGAINDTSDFAKSLVKPSQSLLRRTTVRAFNQAPEINKAESAEDEEVRKPVKKKYI